MDVKNITLSFAIPANIDTPSETLAAMKAVIVESLLQRRINAKYHTSGYLSDEDLALVDALLTES